MKKIISQENMIFDLSTNFGRWGYLKNMAINRGAIVDELTTIEELYEEASNNFSKGIEQALNICKGTFLKKVQPLNRDQLLFKDGFNHAILEISKILEAELNLSNKKE